VPSNLAPELCPNAHELAITGPVTIDTDAGTVTEVDPEFIHFEVIQQGPDLPEIGAFYFDGILIAADVQVTGTRALALVACRELVLRAKIDACAVEQLAGPGGWEGGRRDWDGSGYPGGFGIAGETVGGAASGGGGGANGGAGGAGGGDPDQTVVGGAGGQAYSLDAGLIPLLGGSGGGGGGGSNSGGAGGGGGGAVQLVAGGLLQVEAGGGVDACGAGGLAATVAGGGGGGGGAGGAVLLEAREVDVQGTLAANGGGGGGGRHDTVGEDPTSGEDGPFGSVQAAGGTGGDGGGDGGAGGGAQTGDGAQALDSPASGGGGGAAGRIHINTREGAAVLEGVLSPGPESGLMTQGSVSIW
jgi:hypothetical protein